MPFPQIDSTAIKRALMQGGPPPMVSPIGADPSLVPSGPAPMPIPGPPQQMDPSYNEAGMRQAMAQAFGGASGPPIPQDYLDKIKGIQELIEPGPAMNRYTGRMDQIMQQPHLEGLKSRMAGFGKQLLMGGGLRGAIMGAVDPTQTEMMWNLNKAQPLAQAAQIEQQVGDSRFNRMNKIADLTGTEPITGTRTPAAAYKDAMAEAAGIRAMTGQQRADTYGQNVNSQISDRLARARRQDVNSLVNAYRLGALNNDPQALIALGEKLGVPNPELIEPKMLAGMLRPIVDKNFQVGVLNMQDGTVTPTGTTSVKKTEEANKQQRADTIAGQRQQGLNIQKKGLALREKSEARLSETDARKQAEKEFPFPPFDPDARAGIVEQRKKRVQELMEEKGSAPSGQDYTSDPRSRALATKAGLPEGSAFTGKRRRNISNGQIEQEVKMPDGTVKWVVLGKK